MVKKRQDTQPAPTPSKSNSVYHVGYSIINKFLPWRTGGFANNFSILREQRKHKNPK
ncbi:hypothetical protein MKW98_009170 [Papaver atlanticum]|uniref:Uncharacterized protein n=1 Tax=Papaver atlanticum TaxID=357466 RepID=A0AAD4T824_9MAGN|nr:hypothetical protein MKW98_009170 [Papaver atlanticum]